MDSNLVPVRFWLTVSVALLLLTSVPLRFAAQAVSADPAKMPRIGSVDQRFASYNIEMAEVTGGNFWKPYHHKSSAATRATQPPQSASAPLA